MDRAALLAFALKQREKLLEQLPVWQADPNEKELLPHAWLDLIRLELTIKELDPDAVLEVGNG